MPHVRLPTNTSSAAKFLAGDAEETDLVMVECIICIVLLVLSQKILIQFWNKNEG